MIGYVKFVESTKAVAQKWSLSTMPISFKISDNKFLKKGQSNMEKS